MITSSPLQLPASLPTVGKCRSHASHHCVFTTTTAVLYTKCCQHTNMHVQLEAAMVAAMYLHHYFRHQEQKWLCGRMRTPRSSSEQCIQGVMALEAALCDVLRYMCFNHCIPVGLAGQTSLWLPTWVLLTGVRTGVRAVIFACKLVRLVGWVKHVCGRQPGCCSHTVACWIVLR
jgi:hypothetical protein